MNSPNYWRQTCAKRPKNTAQIVCSFIKTTSFKKEHEKYKFFVEEMEQDVIVNNYNSKIDKFESIDFYSAVGTNVM